MISKHCYVLQKRIYPLSRSICLSLRISFALTLIKLICATALLCVCVCTTYYPAINCLEFINSHTIDVIINNVLESLIFVFAAAAFVLVHVDFIAVFRWMELYPIEDFVQCVCGNTINAYVLIWVVRRLNEKPSFFECVGVRGLESENYHVKILTAFSAYRNDNSCVFSREIAIVSIQ